MPSRARISGLISASGCLRVSLTSMTSTRLCTFTCVAARPMPGAAYMVSNMSSMSVAQRCVHLRDGLRTGAQARIGKFQNWK